MRASSIPHLLLAQSARSEWIKASDRVLDRPFSSQVFKPGNYELLACMSPSVNVPNASSYFAIDFASVRDPTQTS